MKSCREKVQVACLKQIKMMSDRPVATPPQFLLFGDSLTQVRLRNVWRENHLASCSIQRGFESDRLGWAAQLANDWIRRADVIDRGFSGAHDF